MGGLKGFEANAKVNAAEAFQSFLKVGVAEHEVIGSPILTGADFAAYTSLAHEGDRVQALTAPTAKSGLQATASYSHPAPAVSD